MTEETEQVTKPTRIRVHSKVDFDKIKTQLRAKAENEDKPMWLNRESGYEVTMGIVSASGPDFITSGSVDFGNVGYASTCTPDISSMYSRNDPFFSMLSRLPAAHAVWKP
jgi:hypothetical protein